MAVNTAVPAPWEVETGESEAEGPSGYITEFEATQGLPETLSYNSIW